MLSDGRCSGPRPWPEGSQRLAAVLKRLAKMFVGQWAASFGSYHATHGTVRPVPAKSIDGASASWVGSMLSDAGNPCVTHAPFLNARTKICCSPPATFCSKVAHGTRTLPAVTAPPATSETPACWFGAIALARSVFTCEPLAGSGRKAARPAGAARRATRAAMAHRGRYDDGLESGANAARVHRRAPLSPSSCGARDGLQLEGRGRRAHAEQRSRRRARGPAGLCPEVHRKARPATPTG